TGGDRPELSRADHLGLVDRVASRRVADRGPLARDAPKRGFRSLRASGPSRRIRTTALASPSGGRGPSYFRLMGDRPGTAAKRGWPGRAETDRVLRSDPRRRDSGGWGPAGLSAGAAP